jgi:uncharacterized iron-regulated protein
VRILSPLALALLTLWGAVPLYAQHPERPVSPVEGVAFRVYDAQGRPSSFAELIAAAQDTDALLVGEVHDDRVGHALETEILLRAAQRVGAVGGEGDGGRTVVLSLEMFEQDVQYIVDEYLAGLISEDQFTKSSRPWPRYATDYRTMVEFARAHDLPVVAANAPRRYVNRVSREGAESLSDLSDAARAFLPPLPYPGPSAVYAQQWNDVMSGPMSETCAQPDPAPVESGMPSAAEADEEEGAGMPAMDHGTMGRILQAQALWDAAMGYSIVQALAANPGALVVHYVGGFHVAYGTGIPERVSDYAPETRMTTVMMEPVHDIQTWVEEEYGGLGDFVVLTQCPTGSP